MSGVFILFYLYKVSNIPIVIYKIKLHISVEKYRFKIYIITLSKKRFILLQKDNPFLQKDSDNYISVVFLFL